MTPTPDPGTEPPSGASASQEAGGGPQVTAEQVRDVSRLRRSGTDRRVAGVAGGLGRHLDVDPTVLRVVFCVLAFFGGAGVLVYAAMWLVVPEDSQQQGLVPTSVGARTAVLVLVAAVAALIFLGTGWGGVNFPWPPMAVLAVVAAGLLLFRDRSGRAQRSAPAGNADSGLGPEPPSGPAEQVAPAPTTAPEPAPYAARVTPPAGPWVPMEPTATPAPDLTAQEPAPQPPASRGRLLLWPTLCVLGIGLGALGIYDAAGHAVAMSAYPALALAVVGGALVLGAWFGRAGGLVLTGVLTALALAVTSVLGAVSVAGAHTPTTAAQVADHYAATAGTLRVDLSEVADPARLDGRSVSVRVSAGRAVVVLPPGVTADVHAEVSGAGQIMVGDVSVSGTGLSRDQVLRAPDGPRATDARIDLRVSAIVGEVEVRRP